MHAVKLIVGGIAAIVVGFLLLGLVPREQVRRAGAAFPLGVILIWLGVRMLRSNDA